MNGPERTAIQRRASAGPNREAGGLFAPAWEHVAIIALAALAVGGSAAVLVASDDQSALEIAILLVAVALALASLLLTVEARRRRVLAYAQLLRSVAETTVDMHGMIARFRRQDVDDELLNDTRNALVDARELRMLLGGERPEVAELTEVARMLQTQFAPPAPIPAETAPSGPAGSTR